VIIRRLFVQYPSLIKLMGWLSKSSRQNAGFYDSDPLTIWRQSYKGTARKLRVLQARDNFWLMFP